MATPTQRTLGELKKRGYTSAIVERWNQWAKVRQDLYGFIDVLAIKEGEPGVLAVQATSDSNVAARITKISALPAAQVWLKSGNRIVVWGWGKKGKAGKRKLWTLREVAL